MSRVDLRSSRTEEYLFKRACTVNKYSLPLARLVVRTLYSEQMMSRKKTSDEPVETILPSDQRKILGLAVNTLGRNILWSLSRRTAQQGALPGAYPIIAWLMQLSDSTQGELSRLIGIEQPTMALTLRRMERNGLIQRTPDPDHGRRTHVKLTAKGRSLSHVMRVAAHDVEKIATNGLTPAEVAQFFRLAGIMIQNLTVERYGRK
jgi:DNA-binding MarR family transcriptional regulator